MILTREQIADFVDRVGQPRASVLLNRFFLSYRHTLTSSDVAALYDAEYERRVSQHREARRIDGRFTVNVYNEHTFRYLEPRLGPRVSVLDVGCGNGQFDLALAASGAGRVVGTDFSASAIAAANEAAAGTGLSCEFIHTHDLEMPTGPFSFVVLNDVTEHLADAELHKLFRALDPVLAPDGEIVIHTPNGLGFAHATDETILVRLWRRYLQLRGAWQEFERTVDQLYYDQVHINIKSFRQLRDLLRKHGYVADVRYDEPGPWRIFDALSANMLVIARRR